MSKLGLALLAADEYYKEGDRRQVRDYQQKLRDADLSVLDDRTAATRSGYQDTTASNAARAQLRPGQTANAMARQGIEATDIAGQAERQPTEIKAKGIQAGLTLANAENDQANLPTSLQIKNDTLQGQAMTTADSLKQLPAKLARAATQGVLDQQGQSDVVLGTMGQLIGRQDKAGALAFANAVAKQGNVLPNSNGKVFTDIVPVRKGDEGAQGDGYLFVTSTGERIFTPVEAIGGAMQKLKSGKYKFIERDDGSIFAGDEGTGRGGIVQPGDPNISKSGRGGNTPAELQTMEYLVRHGVARDRNEAWNLVRSAREKTRNSFVMEYVGKNAMPGQDTSKLAQEAGRIYDTLPKESGSAPSSATAQQRRSSAPVDPDITSLLGLPQQGAQPAPAPAVAAPAPVAPEQPAAATTPPQQQLARKPSYEGWMSAKAEREQLLENASRMSPGQREHYLANRIGEIDQRIAFHERYYQLR